MAVLRLDRARLAAAAHRNGATTNDAVLIAVTAALHQILLRRGEFVDPIVITVPVSGRRPGGGREVGNLVSPMLVKVPASGEVGERLGQVDAAVRAHKRQRPVLPRWQFLADCSGSSRSSVAIPST
jgi:diacylglycerol O-acyltransferase / wax synthase